MRVYALAIIIALGGCAMHDEPLDLAHEVTATDLVGSGVRYGYACVAGNVDIEACVAAAVDAVK